MSPQSSKPNHDPSPYTGDGVFYWEHRRDLFDRFDEGVCYDLEGLYSIKPEVIARQIAALLPGETVVDAFGGLGGTAIAFGLAGKATQVIEIVRTRAVMLRANTSLFGVNGRVRVHDGDAYTLVPQMRADALYLDPPWGGPSILRRPRVGFELFPEILPGFVHAMRSRFPTVAISLPPNFDGNQLSGEFKPDRLHIGTIWGRPVVLTAFFGPSVT